MANKKITELDSYSDIQNDDVFPVVDVANDITKKFSWSALISALLAFFLPYIDFIGYKLMTVYGGLIAFDFSGNNNNDALLSLDNGDNALVFNNIYRFYDNGLYDVLGLNSRTLHDTISAVSVDFDLRYLYNNVGDVVLDFSGGVPLMPTLRSGTLVSPPSGLITGELWKDTTTSSTNPIVRCYTP